MHIAYYRYIMKLKENCCFYLMKFLLLSYKILKASYTTQDLKGQKKLITKNVLELP